MSDLMAEPPARGTSLTLTARLNTSALDARSEQLIKASLRKLMEGRTTFIIAHRLSTVREVDLILVLKDGAIVEQGTHDTLVKVPGGIYRGLYEMQTGFGG